MTGAPQRAPARAYAHPHPSPLCAPQRTRNNHYYDCEGWTNATSQSSLGEINYYGAAWLVYPQPYANCGGLLPVMCCD